MTEDGHTNQRRFLIVDDQELNWRVLSLMLRRLGHAEPDVARSGEEAVAKVQEGPTPQVIFMDVWMPGIDGLEATRQIRAHCAPEEQPWIVAVTGAVYEADREQCLAAGMNAFVEKPVTEDGLKAAIERAFDA